MFLWLASASAGAQTLVTGSATGVTDLQATLTGTINPNGGSYSMQFEYGTTTNYGSTVTAAPSSASGSFVIQESATVTTLLPNTGYHYRIRAGASAVGGDMTFTTGPAATPPTVTTGSISSLGATQVTAGASISSGSSAALLFVDYGTSTAYGSQAVYFNAIPALTTAEESVSLTGLTPGTLYHYRARAVNDQGTSTGVDGTFTTPMVPKAITKPATSVTDLSATLNGAYNPAGGQVFVGYQYGTTTDYGQVVTDGTHSGNSDTILSHAVSNLTPGTTYHYRLYLTDGANLSYYGSDMTFTTAAPQTPSQITTGSVGSITPAGASLGASVAPGGFTATLGFDYGTTTAYGSHADRPTSYSPSSNTFSSQTVSVGGLAPATLYHYRATLTNNQGTFFGADMTFTTLVAPIVTTGAPTAVSDLSATLNGTANANVSSGITYTAAFEFGTDTSYGASVSASPSSVSGNTTKSLSAIPSGLLPATTYHYRLKLTTSSGIPFYGSDATFNTTAAATPPSATTAAATLITATTAYLGATNASSGSSAGTLGFRYGLTTAYSSTVDFIPQPANHTYAFLGAAVTGLTPGTTYHFAVTGTNQEGTRTGSDLTFTTQAAATVSTSAATGVINASATINGTVDPNGVSSTFSFEYGLTTAYGSQVGVSAVSGTALLNKSTVLRGLTPLTTYHYRARVDNLDGTFYGDDLTFTTTNSGVVTPVLPSVGDVTTNYEGPNSASLLASSVSAGSSDATVVFEYSTTNAYEQQVTAPSPVPAGSFKTVYASVSGLSPNTIYHVRARVTNNEGTTYSVEGIFLTPGAAVVVTGAATSVTDVSAVVGGMANGKGLYVSLAVEFGPTAAYGKSVTATPYSVTDYTDYPLTATLTGLTPNTLYHYHVVGNAYDIGVVYDGGDMTFTTGPPGSAPAGNTGSATPGSSTAFLNASDVSAGGADATLSWEYGLDTTYGSAANYSSILSAGTVVDSTSITITGLTPQTIYHYRVRVTNSFGTVYGADATFTTKATSYSASTAAAAAIRSKGAALNGSFTSSSGSSVLSFDYGLDTTYGSSAAVKNTNSSSGTFAVVVQGLLPATTYHYRAVNTNATGTAYGADMTFTTLADLSPTATTGTATGSPSGTVTFRGIANASGSVTSVVFEYGLNTSYSMGSTTLPASVSGNADTPVSIVVTGLTANSTYHYRLVASNAQGISYGADASVQMAQPPVIASASVSNVSRTRAYVSGSASPTPTAAYVEYGTTTAYDLGSVPATFPQSPTVYLGLSSPGQNNPPLQPNTLYHCRLVVGNAAGYTYGGDLVFTTDMPTPSVANQQVTGITSTSATLGATITENGGTDTLGFDYGLTDTYGATLTASPASVAGADPVSASATLMGLMPGTVYHYRFKASHDLNGGTSTNGFGDRTFTTLTLAENWRQQNFGATGNTGDAADNANPAGDGINNLMKYALGLDPKVASSALPQAVTKNYGGTNYLSYTFVRNPQNTDLTYEVQVADSPAGPWTPIADSFGGGATTGAGFVGETPATGGMISVEVRDTVSTDSAPRRFIRLQVTR